MKPYYDRDGITVHHGDCLDVLTELPDASVDAVVTDPPYNLSFMAKPWDAYEGHEDAGFAYWLGGLIDGEGHFAIKAHTRGTHAPYFALKMRADEKGTLDRIRRTLGIGSVTVEHRAEGNDMGKWTVQDKAGCQRLVDLLDKYELRAKKVIDYWTWREAVCEWTDRPRGNRWHGSASNDRMAVLRERLMSTRAYVEIPWSGHEFQDWCRLWTAECLRVLKPGGHLLAFGGTRTWHRLAVAVEDAGFEIRDSIAWMYGSGFPKSLDVSKAIDKMNGRDLPARYELARHIRSCREAAKVTRAEMAAWFPQYREVTANWERCDEHGNRVPTPSDWAVLRERLDVSDEWLPFVERVEAEREVIRLRGGLAGSGFGNVGHGLRSASDAVADTAPATPDAERWQGWGTALKPAFEPIVVARKPLAGTVAANVLAHGTGALNIDGARIETTDDLNGGAYAEVGNRSESASLHAGSGMNVPGATTGKEYVQPSGRWPANVILDESQSAALDEQSGESVSRAGGVRQSSNAMWGRPDHVNDGTSEYDDQGGASRFFYCAKADAAERPKVNGTAHPTVKPLSLMRWLVRLVTPPGGTVLEPFAGSGTTVEACILERFNVVAIEREADYLPLIEARITRRRDPARAVELAGEDMGLLSLIDEETA